MVGALRMLAGKKIIFLLGSMKLGGAERQALFLAQYLLEREDAVVEVWGIGAAGPVTRMCDDSGISWRNISLNFGAGPIRDFIEIARLSQLIYQAAPDILLPYTWFPNVLCGFAWRLTGARVCIWNQRDSGLFLDPTRAVHRLAVKLTPFFISNSTHAATFLIDNFKIDPQRLTIIPNGIRLAPPQNDRPSWRRRLGIEDNDFVGCMIANFSPIKDHATAVRAWRSVVNHLVTCRRRAVLVLAGRDDGMVDGLRALIHELHLERDVRILDAVDDVAGLLASCDVAVHCAEHEGCPNAVLEEMAAGLPVVASDNNGVRMILGDEGKSFIAPFQDSEGIAQRILHLALDSENRTTVGRNNIQRIQNNHNIETMCSNITQFIAHTLKSRN